MRWEQSISCLCIKHRTFFYGTRLAVSPASSLVNHDSSSILEMDIHWIFQNIDLFLYKGFPLCSSNFAPTLFSFVRSNTGDILWAVSIAKEPCFSVNCCDERFLGVLRHRICAKICLNWCFMLHLDVYFGKNVKTTSLIGNLQTFLSSAPGRSAVRVYLYSLLYNPVQYNAIQWTER